MNALAEIFKLETLDSRFVPDKAERTKNRSRASPPRWKTFEFYFYAVIFLIFVPLMFITAISAGSPKNPGYKLFKDKLSPGWMGRPVDNSDIQYSSMRSQLPILTLLSTTHVALRRIAALQRSIYDFTFGIFLITLLHGTGALKILTILSLNYSVGLFKSRSVCWAFAVGILFANELTSGYELPVGISYGSFLAAWQVFFKCTMMRMLSYNLDYIESLGATPKKSDLRDSSAETRRITVPRPPSEYNFVDYIGFCLYAPLYLAGPILSFNDFQSQKQLPLPSISAKRTVIYGIRFLLCLLCMEFILHFIPVIAMSESRAWTGLTPAQVSMVGFFNLVVIWLKLLIPWRFFRLWALADAIDPPENMVRCVANNYSALSFWRSWHRSFHRWVIRYLYVPLGGSRHQLRNSLIVFSFVAIWHDIQLRLFLWGGLIVLFVMPEIVARRLVPFKTYGTKKWYRYIAGMGAVANIWMMLIANLVGFAVGPDGIKALLYEMVHTAAGLKFSILCSLLLFVGVQVMFEYREQELREGINMKC